MMQKTRSLSIRTIVLLIVSVLAIALCFTGTARAALAYFSPDYEAEFSTTSLEVGLYENGKDVTVKTDGDSVTGGKLLTWIDEDNVSIVPGQTYPEVLTAVNTGDYEEYVRVVVKKYWMNGDDKAVNINPALIQLEEADGWIKDDANTTDEQIVLYSVNPIPVDGSLDFIKTLRIDPAIVTDPSASKVDETTITNEDGTTKTIFTTVYTIDGYTFNIEAEVDAVQTHNATDAMKSVWGYDRA